MLLRNEIQEQLYVGIFDFRMSWEMKPLTSSSFLIIPARHGAGPDEREIAIQMKVPDYVLEAGRTKCVDVFKMIVTTKATHFRLALPSILQVDCGQHNEYATWFDDVVALLADLNGGHRGAGGSEWATISFQVCTSLKKSEAQ